MAFDSLVNDKWTVLCERGGNWHFPMVCDNGDLLDSNLYIYQGCEQKASFSFVNTDFTVGYKGGILKEGTYDFIVGDWKGKYLALELCQNLTPKDKWNTLTEEQLTLPSLIPNPNHGGKCQISSVWVHQTWGDWDGDGKPDKDGSEGCITILAREFYRLSNLFKLNDRGKFKLERALDWTPPSFYKG